MTLTLRLDSSKKNISEVHGDRTPDDPHYRVCYWQDELPFDARGELVPDDGKTGPWIGLVEGKQVEFFPLYTPERRQKRDAKLARLNSGKAAIEAEVDIPAPVKGDSDDDVNLESWLRGEVDYEQFALLKAAKTRYSRNYTRLRDLVEDLVYDEKIVPEDQVAPRLIRMLSPDAA
jgi:hypothetical protein